MILTRLHEYAQRKRLMDDSAFEDKPVPWMLLLEPDGRPRTLITTLEQPPESDKQGKGKPRPIARSYPIPKVQGKNKGGVATPCVDKATFVLGPQHWFSGDKDRAKAERDHAAFVALMTDVAQQTDDEGCRAIVRFLERLDAGELELPDLEEKKVKHSDLIGFRLADEPETPVFKRDTFRRWWMEQVRAQETTQQSDAVQGVCLVTGAYGPIAETHPMKISGIPGGQSSGTVLVGMDKDAFQSYGFDKSRNGPVNPTVAESYARALNALIRDKSSIRTAQQVTVVWDKLDKVQEVVAEVVDPMVEGDAATPIGSQDGSARDDLTAPWSGHRGDIADPDAVYVLALGGNGGRAVVLDWLETRLDNVQRNVAQWWADLALVDPFGGQARRPALYPLSVATVRDPKDVSPNVMPALVRAALGGGPLPQRILAACIARLRAEGEDGFTRPRLALIKLTVNRLRRIRKESFPMPEIPSQLDKDLQDPAYHCGRLFALYAEIQKLALGKINAGVVDKFYGTASVMPARVFPFLDRLAMKHLRKARDKRPYAAKKLEKEMEEIMDQARAGTRFPGRFSMEQQGAFVLGFHLQRAELRTKRSDKVSDEQHTEEVSQ